MGRGLVLLAVLFGQVGLPNFNLFALTETSCQHPRSAPGAKCRCSPSLRRIGRCCCSAKSAAHVKSNICHTKPVAAAKSCCARPKEPILAFRDACGCGQGSETHAYRCIDPRVMPPKLVVSVVDMPALADGLLNETSCGELLPPPLPPPKASLG